MLICLEGKEEASDSTNTLFKWIFFYSLSSFGGRRISKQSSESRSAQESAQGSAQEWFHIAADGNKAMAKDKNEENEALDGNCYYLIWRIETKLSERSKMAPFSSELSSQLWRIMEIQLAG